MIGKHRCDVSQRVHEISPMFAKAQLSFEIGELLYKLY
jgi:hypothetical protein